MKPTDLKNGMMLYTRGNDKKYYIINGYVYYGYINHSLEMICTLASFMEKYNDNFTYCCCKDNDKDITKIFNINGELLWDEVNWNKVPIDTKVLVKDDDNNKWIRRHYAGYDEEKKLFIAFTDGGTSWTTKDTTEWAQCKLEDEEDKEKLEDKEISANDLNEEFSEFCKKSFPHCKNCKYDMDNLCKMKWLLDTYKLTKK